MNIGITYNLKSEIYNINPEHILIDDAFEEFDTEETIDAIADIIRKNGHKVIKLGWGKQAIKSLLSSEIDFVFNISEGYWGRNREAQMPALLEMLDIPYNGSDPLTLSLALDKVSSKKILSGSGIRVPAYFVIGDIKDIKGVGNRLKYPLFVKPVWEGSSKGIQFNSKVNDEKALIAYVKELLEKYPNQPVLVEEYIAGREFTVGVVGNNQPNILGVMQIYSNIPGETDFFYSKEVKRDWKSRVVYECPPKIDLTLKEKIEKAALQIFSLFQCRDIARIDFRVDPLGQIYFLEINPLPGLSPEYSDIVIMARKMGWTYEKLIRAIFNSALSRLNFCEAHTSYKTGKGEAE